MRLSREDKTRGGVISIIVKGRSVIYSIRRKVIAELAEFN